MNTERYYFEKGKLFRERKDTYELGLQGEAIAAMTGMGQMSVLNLTEGVDCMTLSNDPRGTTIMLTSRIEKLKFNTFFVPYDGEVFGDPNNWPALKPYWRECQGAIKADVEWIPPAYMKLFFVSEFVSRTGYDRHPDWSGNSLVAKIDEDIYRPPVPNVYNHGGICMGSHFQPSGQSMFQDFSECLEDFSSTEWNRDLMEDQCRYLLFKADDNGAVVPIYPDKDTQLNCLEIISSQRFNFMNKI